MKKNNAELTNKDDAYKNYLEDIEKRKTARLDLIENLSEEEIREIFANYYGNVDFKKAMLDFCLYLNLKYDFGNLTEYLKGLPNIAEKLKVLHTLKYDFEREIEMTKGMPYTKDYLDSRIFNFDKACQSEIEKYTILMDIEKAEIATKDGIEKHKDLNQRTATLFVSYLLDFANEKKRENFGLKNKKSLADADKDRIIDFLTPISGKQSKKLHKPFKDEIAKIAENIENSKEFYDDMQIIRKYFEMLGLSEITNRIDADLGEKPH